MKKIKKFRCIKYLSAAFAIILAFSINTSCTKETIDDTNTVEINRIKYKIYRTIKAPISPSICTAAAGGLQVRASSTAKDSLFLNIDNLSTYSGTSNFATYVFPNNSCKTIFYLAIKSSVGSWTYYTSISDGNITMDESTYSLLTLAYSSVDRDSYLLKITKTKY